MSDAIFTTRQSEPAKAQQQFSGGPTSNRPSNAARWLHYFDTDLGFTVVWDGSRWRTGTPGPRGSTGPIGNVASVDITGGGYGIGLVGTYYGNTTLTGTPTQVRYENVNIPLGVPGIQSARWIGYILIPVSGGFTFSTMSADGVRLYVNNILLINNWTNHASSLDVAPTFAYVAGDQVKVVVEWYNAGFDPAQMQLQWDYPGQATQVVPISAMGPSVV